MKKFLPILFLGLCLMLTACGGGDDDLQTASKVFDKYCAASISGDTDTLVSLTSEYFRKEYEKMPLVNDPDVIAMGKAYTAKSKYEVISMEMKGDDKIAIEAAVSVPDPTVVLKRVEEITPMNEIKGLDNAQVQNLLARKMKQILETENIALVSVNLPVEMVKENGVWKVHFPVNMQSVM